MTRRIAPRSQIQGQRQGSRRSPARAWLPAWGSALLLADVLQPKPRRIPGWTLLAIGILSTLPLVAYVVHNLHTPFDD